MCHPVKKLSAFGWDTPISGSSGIRGVRIGVITRLGFPNFPVEEGN